jgi:AmiR/NasT family two-component response regulator
VTREAIVERAKGVLMGRYLISETEAHGLLRKHARNANLRLVDVARAVLESHVLIDGRRP